MLGTNWKTNLSAIITGALGLALQAWPQHAAIINTLAILAAAFGIGAAKDAKLGDPK